MATNYIVGTIETAARSLVDIDDTLRILRSGTILPSGSVTAVTLSQRNTVTVEGDIATGGIGISSTGGQHKITIAATGAISTDQSAIDIGGSATVRNYGTVLSTAGTAIDVSGGFIENRGNVKGVLGGISSFGAATIINSGAVSGIYSAISMFGGGKLDNLAGGTITGSVGLDAGTINNFGSMVGVAQDPAPSDRGIAIRGGSGVAVINNSGVIRGVEVTPGQLVAIDLGDGGDRYNGAAGRAIGEVRGGLGNDTLIGGNSTDVFRGGDDNDTLTGNGGVDNMDGGDGSDRYILNNQPSNDIINDTGVTGFDTIFSTVTRSLAPWNTIENLTLQGTAAINGIGNPGNNTLSGNGAVNALSGGAGNDTLIGGGGADNLNGGLDNDTYVLGADTSDKITDASGTADRITSTITRSLAGYSTIEQLELVGTANINGTGNGLPNWLLGNAGNNVLRGGGGADTIIGYLGKDSLYGDAGDDLFRLLIVPDIGANRDTIFDFDDAGKGNDTIDLSLLPLVDNASSVALSQSGANVLVAISTNGGSPLAEILLANTTIGLGIGQVSSVDDFIF